MTNLQAKVKMKEYLKGHFIKYREDIEDGVSRYTILFEGYDACPELLNKLSVPIFLCFLEKSMGNRRYQ